MQTLILIALGLLWMPGVAFALVVLMSIFASGWSTLPTASIVISVTAFSLVPPLLFLAKKNDAKINLGVFGPVAFGLPLTLMTPVVLARWMTDDPIHAPLEIAPVTANELARPFASGGPGNPFSQTGMTLSEIIIPLVTFFPVFAALGLLAWAGHTWWASRPSGRLAAQ